MNDYVNPNQITHSIHTEVKPFLFPLKNMQYFSEEKVTVFLQLSILTTLVAFLQGIEKI